MFWFINNAHANTFMPPAASDVAKQVDSLYGFLLIASVISFIILVGGMMYFVHRYKRQNEGDKTAYITHNHTLEFIWSFIPFLIFMGAFVWGTVVYLNMRTFEENAMEVHVYGKKWVWEFEYKNGRKVYPEANAKGELTPSTMVVPLNQPVKLIMTSAKVTPQDKAVLHSFYIPAFRVKQDVIPGRYTALAFTATQLGTFQVFCTEYCGTGHSNMLAQVKVVTPEEFDAWVLGEEAGAGGGKEVSLVDKGLKSFGMRACIGCHSLDGKANVGPTWKGLFGSKRTMSDGSTVTADENYLRESIWVSQKKLVKGYEKANPMPAFKGQIEEEEMTALIELIKSVK